MSIRKWPDIEGLHVIVRDLRRFEESSGQKPPTVSYRAKVKLDGTNAGVRFVNGQVDGFQSRTHDVTPENDNAGFARWASTIDWPKPYCNEEVPVTVIHGEWAGPGIQKGTACQMIPGKKFFVFAIEHCSLAKSDGGDWETRLLTTDPREISGMLSGWSHPDVHILPWHTQPQSVDLSDHDAVSRFAEEMNQLVDSVEGCDPYLKELFSVEGIGEGVVLYPISEETLNVSREWWKRLAFKAKGEKHRVKKAPRAVEVDPEELKSVEAFVTAFVTQQRCEQGLGAVLRGESPDMRRTGEFIGWISKDVEKESRTELEASGLTWKRVAGDVSKAARDWYMERCKSL
jgi:hypothetical protein